MKLHDMLGKEFNVGDKVVHPTNFGNTPILSIKFVCRIEDNKLYLNNRGVPIKFPERLLNLTVLIGEENESE